MTAKILQFPPAYQRPGYLCTSCLRGVPSDQVIPCEPSNAALCPHCRLDNLRPFDADAMRELAERTHKTLVGFMNGHANQLDVLDSIQAVATLDEFLGNLEN